MRKFLGLAIFFLIGLLLSLGMTYKYYIPIKVYYNASGTLSDVPILVSLNNAQLVGFGYISDDGLDSSVYEATESREFGITDSKLGLVIPELLGYQERTYGYRLSMDPPLSSFPVIVGVGGSFTVSDSSTLELGTEFDIELEGWVDTASGSNKNIIYKQDAFRLYVQAGGTIRAAILTTGDSEVKIATVSGISSQELKIEVKSDGTDMTLTVWDGTGTYLGSNSVALEGTGVPDNGNSWYFMQNDVMVYLRYLKVWV